MAVLREISWLPLLTCISESVICLAVMQIQWNYWLISSDLLAACVFLVSKSEDTEARDNQAITIIQKKVNNASLF